tara:strand:- start:3260 stop:4090 length:831 start_codon:yes stop_codon:yes gene_type:complete
MSLEYLDDIYNFEGNIEACIAQFLENELSSSVDVATTVTDDILTLPRVSVSLESGGAIDPADIAHTSSNLFEYRKYNGVVSLVVASDASSDNSDEDTLENHKLLRSQVRKQMRLNATNWNVLSTNSIRLTGAGSASSNGYYTRETNDVNSKPSFRNQSRSSKNGDRISFTDIGGVVGSNTWQIYNDDGSSQSVMYETTENTATYPWQVTTWDALAGVGSIPVPSVSQWRSIKYYDVNYCRPTGTNFEVDGDLAVSTLTYEINFVIRNDIENIDSNS